MQRYLPKNRLLYKNKKIKVFKFKSIKPYFNKPLIQTEKKKEFFKDSLYIRKYLKLFYGDLSIIQIKNLLRFFDKKTRVLKKTTFLDFFCLLEMRIDVILYRLYIAKSIFHAKQLINHKKIYVNKKLITSSYFFLKEGDIVEFPKLSILKIKKNLAYIECNSQLSSFVFLRPPVLKEITYPFLYNFKLFFESFKK